MRLTFSGLPTGKAAGVFFGVYYPASANTTKIAPLAYPATAPWTAQAPAKWLMCSAVAGCEASGAGTYDFELVNTFQDCRIVAFTGGINAPVEVASSPVISFTDNAAPLRVHVMPTTKGSEMRVVWNTAHQDETQTVRWGTSSGAYTGSALAQPRTYTVDDMCGEPATTQGWFSPGMWQTALMTALAPDTVYYYSVGSAAAGAWSAEQSFKTGPVVGPDAAVNILAFADLNVNERDGTIVHWNEPDPGLTMQHMSDLARSGSGYDYTLAVHAGDIR